MKKAIAWIIFIIIVIVAGVWLWHHNKSLSGHTVTFACDQNKSIQATFNTATGSPVTVKLSDGRTVTLPQVISANGARYANSDESIVFWNVGNTAFLSENGTTTYANCAIPGTQPTAPTSNSTVTLNGGVTETYTNNQYNFSLTYAQDLQATSTFAHFHNLNSYWRALVEPDANGNVTGTSVVAIPVFSVDHGGVATGQPYPLYFDAEVRVGMSTSTTDVTNCLKPDPGFTSEPVQSVTFGGATWKAYSFADQAMMQYVKGTSYRTVHNGVCVAVEAVETGSVYKDDTMTAGISDDQLNQYFTEANNIAQSFTFTP